MCTNRNVSMEAIIPSETLVTGYRGRAIAQAVFLQLLTAKDRVRSLGSQCGICGGQTGTGTGFSPIPSIFPYQCYSIFTLVLSGGLAMGPLEAAVPRGHSITPFQQY
jgi:hypothetical protein